MKFDSPISLNHSFDFHVRTDYFTLENSIVHLKFPSLVIAWNDFFLEGGGVFVEVENFQTITIYHMLLSGFHCYYSKTIENILSVTK